MSPRPKQVYPRYRRRVEVRYTGAGHPQRIGFSGNMSLSGMMLRTPIVLPPGTIATLEVHFPSAILTFKGRVMWAREGPMTLLSTGRIGMGIRFIDPPRELGEMMRKS